MNSETSPGNNRARPTRDVNATLQNVAAPDAVTAPDHVTLPPGRTIQVEGRGAAFVRQSAPVPDAPTVVLLHGWAATADLNWFRSYEALGQKFNVLAMDHRGHGRGIRDGKRFRLQDCADDIAALLTITGTKAAIVVGYSMGGSVAQLLWRRHPELVRGMVLCATAMTFKRTAREQAMFAAIAPTTQLVRLAPARMRNSAALRIMLTRDDREVRQWALAEMKGHDWVSVLEAGREIGSFDSSAWISGIDVPTAQIMTLDDNVVSLARQETLAEALPRGSLHLVPGGHSVCIEDPDTFVPTLLRAITDVEQSRVSH